MSLFPCVRGGGGALLTLGRGGGCYCLWEGGGGFLSSMTVEDTEIIVPLLKVILIVFL